jgi:hypothetical protein
MMLLRAKRAWPFLILLAGCQPSARPPSSGDTMPSAETLARPTNGPAVTGKSSASALAGDTLELVSIGTRRLSEWRGVDLPCDSARTPLFERIVFIDDSSYFGVTADRPGCRDPLVSSSDTLLWQSIYRLHGDTLTLYTGDGDEVFQSYNGLLFPDSVVQVSIGKEHAQRYSRRHGASARRK